ncbi:PTS sugar transporter subunit IIC [Ligilactobacillus pobuzihii]|uniref:Permease IIC component n=1 Tax=Ligilactobacillus pobuzihii TaxID=449659 RepID=A0A0R2LH77_9LACO|nr:PTS transporter subunit EIIC [Ligilactobacillus pobuzihii]KRK09265.1 PTS system, IIC component [Ligilactobacillus pobuzihii E100301 = KCTC 13174]KRO01156.1 PTS system, IIC component [Ligilactobacillus pobuzihii]GEN49084.1 permease IIC component [Ligilactobacillus pobuzihii]
MSVGQKIQSGLEKTLAPTAAKLGKSKILRSLSNGVIMTLPLTLGASIFMVIANFPIPAFTEWLNKIGVADQLNAIAGGTLNILALFISFTVAYCYTKELGAKPEVGGLLSLASFLILAPQMVGSGKASLAGFANSYLGSQGIFVAIIVALLVGCSYSKLSHFEKLTIKLPDSVPPMIADSFSPLIIGIIIFAGDFVVRLVFSFTSWGNVFDFINKIVAAPLMSVGGSVPAFIFVYMLANLFFWFGLHPAPIQSVMQTIATSMMLATITQSQAHEPLKYLSNLAVFDFVNNDGTGSTLSLLVAALIFGKSKRYRSLAKIAIGPNIFGINEPVIFGMPIMFNAIMVIPFVCSTLISAFIAWIAVKIHFITTINATVMMSMPWTLPKFITSFFTYGWQGVVLRIIVFITLICLYLPFFRILDQQEMKKELEADN